MFCAYGHLNTSCFSIVSLLKGVTMRPKPQWPQGTAVIKHLLKGNCFIKHKTFLRLLGSCQMGIPYFRGTCMEFVSDIVNDCLNPKMEIL